jgi:hypothetical protein
VPKQRRPYVKLNEEYIKHQTQFLSEQIADLENRLKNVKAAAPQGVSRDSASRGTAVRDTTVRGPAQMDTAAQLMKLIREKKQYLNEFCVTRHAWLKRSTPPNDPRQQYRKSY